MNKKVKMFDALLNEMFGYKDKVLLIFALRYNYDVYLFGAPATGKTLLYTILCKCGFTSIGEAGNYNFGPYYIPYDALKFRICLMTNTIQHRIGKSSEYFDDVLNEIKDYIMSDFVLLQDMEQQLKAKNYQREVDDILGSDLSADTNKTKEEPHIQKHFVMTEKQAAHLSDMKIRDLQIELGTRFQRALLRLHIETVLELCQYIEKYPFYENKKSYIWTNIGKVGFKRIVNYLDIILP